MNLGHNILSLCRQKGVTQEGLAAALGVTAAAVSKWENNYTLPDVLMLSALADFFAVTTDELLGRAKSLRYAVISAQTNALGKKVADIAKEYGILARSIHTNYEEAKSAVSADGSIQYLISCYTSGGFYGGHAQAIGLVSVAPDEEDVLTSIRDVFKRYAEN